ncbi:MAG: YitT family protein [Clostridia bacterium]|nr:YitT family protein [Clostridia bacterium]
MNNNKTVDFITRLLVVVFANLLLAFATVWFLEPAKLFAGGATGIAQLAQRLFLRFGLLNNVNLGWFILVANVPVIIIGIKYVSWRFTLYSGVAVGVQTVATIFMPESPFNSLKLQIEEYVAKGEAIPFSDYGILLTLAICGGVLAGVASGMALKFGTSTGGFDVIGQALALKKNISIGTFTIILNVLIAIFGGGVLQSQWILALFTIIRMVLNSLIVDKIHTSYTFTALHVFTDSAEAIANDIMHEMGRGCTYENVTGAYSHKQSVEVYCVLSTYEVDRALKIIDRHDRHAFVAMTPVKKIKGKFIKKTII